MGLKLIEVCVYDPFISIIKLKKVRHGIKQLNHSQEERLVKRLAIGSTLKLKTPCWRWDVSFKGRRPLQAPNRLIAEFNMGCYGYGDSASQRVLIGAHVKFSD